MFDYTMILMRYRTLFEGHLSHSVLSYTPQPYCPAGAVVFNQCISNDRLVTCGDSLQGVARGINTCRPTPVWTLDTSNALTALRLICQEYSYDLGFVVLNYRNSANSRSSFKSLQPELNGDTQ